MLYQLIRRRRCQVLQQFKGARRVAVQQPLCPLQIRIDIGHEPGRNQQQRNQSPSVQAVSVLAPPWIRCSHGNLSGLITCKIVKD